MIKTSIKYKPLYDFLLVDQALENKDKLSPEHLEYFTKLSLVDTCIVTGGRFSAKSYEVGDWDLEATIQHDYKTLYTRFTDVSMSDSVIPEIQEKIEHNSLEQYFKFANNKFISKCGPGLISFKGIKAGAGNQKAKLKSLKGFNVQITDEAEEIPDFETFEKVYFSIRSEDRRNISILIMNPTTKDHWIYQEFFESRGIQGGFNGIHENVLYIHTSYLDVDREIIPDNILRSFERMKKRRPSDYNEIVMGGWVTDLEGAVFKKSEIDTFQLDQLNKQNIEAIVAFIDVADRGTDSLSMPIGAVIGDQVFIIDWYFSTANQDVTIPEIAYLCSTLGIEHLAVETNGVGAAYFESLRNSVGCQMYPFAATGKKHSRIIQNSGFVRNYFSLRNDYEAGTMYDKAIKELFNYFKDDSKNRKGNLNDDAPDSITGLWITVNDLFHGRWI
ncbi:MAG: phage terminase large subunit [Salinimicrobium sp.]